MNQVKVLLAGMKRVDNQFSRAMLKYGCEVIHTDPDPGPFDTNADMAVIVKCQISHQKFWDVKDAYYRSGRPFLVATMGFTEIKEDFERLMKEPRRLLVVPKVEEMEPKKERQKLPKEVLKQIYRVIVDCKENGLDTHETLKMLKAEGFTKANGEDLTTVDIYNALQRIRTNPDLVPSKPKPEPKPEPLVEVSIFNPMDLVGRVMKNQIISQDDKLRIIQAIHDGEIRSEEQIECRIVGQELHISKWELIRPLDRPTLILTRSQAALLLREIETIKAFARVNQPS